MPLFTTLARDPYAATGRVDDLKLDKIGVIVLAVSDLDRSFKFYRDTLGLTGQRTPELAFLSGGGVSLMLRTTPDLKPSDDERRVELVFTVADIDRAHASLTDRGVVFRVEPRVVTPGQLAADFRDPDGHVLSIFGPRTEH